MLQCCAVATRWAELSLTLSLSQLRSRCPPAAAAAVEWATQLALARLVQCSRSRRASHNATRSRACYIYRCSLPLRSREISSCASAASNCEGGRKYLFCAFVCVCFSRSSVNFLCEFSEERKRSARKRKSRRWQTETVRDKQKQTQTNWIKAETPIICSQKRKEKNTNEKRL